MVRTSTVDLERFKNSVGFTATFSAKWGNSRKANIDKVTLEKEAKTIAEAQAGTEATKSEQKKAKERLQLKKQLIRSPEYDAIRSFYGELAIWVRSRTVPSFWKEGFRLVGLSGVNDIQSRMEKAQRDELPALVEKFLAAYPGQIEEARAVLEPVGQFNRLEYPSVEEMRSAFDISWNWIAFTVPEQLPESIRKAETDKLERQLMDAGEQITLALRVGFKELIDHATERLKVDPGEKPKTFKDTLIGNIMEFIDTFQSRNITNDAELAILVSRAKEIIAPSNGKPLSPQKLRDAAMTREETAKQFAEIQATLDGMITTTKGRKFNLEPDGESPAEAPQPSAEAPTQGELAAA